MGVLNRLFSMCILRFKNKVGIVKSFPCTVIQLVSTSAKFDICTIVGLNGTLVEAKMHTF